MGILVIGEPEAREIAEAIERARANPVPLEVGETFAARPGTKRLMLSDRKPGTDAFRERYQPQNVMLGTYRVAFSFEHQRGGLARHLSVSSHTAAKVPGPEVLSMVAEAFGFDPKLCEALAQHMPAIFSPSKPFALWAEEYEPGRMAINIVEIDND